MKANHCLIPAITLGLTLIVNLAAAQLQPNDTQTATPMKHIIVVIGENRSFDHIFAAYKPRPGQSVRNLWSQGIITEDGTPGPNFLKTGQYHAQIKSTYQSAPSQKEVLT